MSRPWAACWNTPAPQCARVLALSLYAAQFAAEKWVSETRSNWRKMYSTLQIQMTPRLTEMIWSFRLLLLSNEVFSVPLNWTKKTSDLVRALRRSVEPKAYANVETRKLFHTHTNSNSTLYSLLFICYDLVLSCREHFKILRTECPKQPLSCSLNVHFCTFQFIYTNLEDKYQALCWKRK